jgi:Histidine kinase-, DNA gyrase B-, and HSP90-like ATPase
VTSLPGQPLSLPDPREKPGDSDDSRNSNTGGVGLGLAVTRSIVWEHGGDIFLANRRGGGLSVRLVLPIGSGLTSPEQEQSSSPQEAVKANVNAPDN